MILEVRILPTYSEMSETDDFTVDWSRPMAETATRWNLPTYSFVSNWLEG